MAKKKNFETSLKRLEEIANEMEKNETTLEASLKLYKEGVETAMFCDIEQQVSILQKETNDLFKLNPFYDVEEY